VRPGFACHRVAAALLAALYLFASQPAQAKALKFGEPFPGFSLPGLGKGDFSTATLKGKTVVIYFWNNLCGCTEQLLALKGFISAQEKKPFAFVTVNEGQAKAIPETFLRDNRLSYQVLLDTDMALGKKQLGIRVLPTVFVIGKDGLLKEKLIGMVDTRKLQSIIERYL
jgi:peroxiredoxin